MRLQEKVHAGQCGFVRKDQKAMYSIVYVDGLTTISWLASAFAFVLIAVSPFRYMASHSTPFSIPHDPALGPCVWELLWLP